MAEGERGGWLPPNGDDDDREREREQGGMSSGDPLWSGREPEPAAESHSSELPGGWQPPAPSGGQPGGWQAPTQGGWEPPGGAPPQTPGWGAPAGGQWGGGAQQQPSYGPQTSNGKATASLVCGILGLIVCPIVFSIAAIVLGYQSRNEIDASQGRQQNRGVATAGIITGWVGIAFGVLLIILVAAGVIAGLEGDSGAGDGDGGLFEPAIALLTSALPR